MKRVLLITGALLLCVLGGLFLGIQHMRLSSDIAMMQNYLGRQLGTSAYERQRGDQDTGLDDGDVSSADAVRPKARILAYRVVINPGFRFDLNDADGVAALAVPVQGYPWWCLYRGAPKVLVLKRDLSVVQRSMLEVLDSGVLALTGR